MNKLILALGLMTLAGGALAAGKPCEELKAEIAAKLDAIGNVGILVQVLAAAATFVALGMMLRRIETEQTSQDTPEAERPRAAGASA